MASTYVNNLRLNEMATGDGSGTWGTTTNTNLTLIGEAFGYATLAVANASTVSVGDETVTGAANVYPTTVAGTGAVSSVSPSTANVLSISGVAATGAVSSLSCVTQTNIYPTGVEGTGNITSLTVWGLIIPGQTANYSAISTGQTTNWEEVA